MNLLFSERSLLIPALIASVAISGPAQTLSDEDGLVLPVRKNLAQAVAGPASQPAPATPTTHPLRMRLPDPLRLRALSANFHPYPDAALFSNEDLLEAPAGKRGFVTVSPDGHLVFADGSRARFWGVTITQEHIDIPKSRIEEVVDALARAGCNMVRFHSLDNRAGEQFGFIRRTIIHEASADTGEFDPEYLDRLHYWIARLKQRGIYTCLVLRGFRHYRDGDGVARATDLPRGARPMAFFNSKLIELQKRFGRALLFETVNPYTGLAPGEDPGVALIELFNEDSLFSRPEAWQNMIEPYRTEFRTLWNDYLQKIYKDDDGLRQAWTDESGRSALVPGESLSQKSMALPLLPLNETLTTARNAATTDPLRSPPRRRDAILFAIQVQRDYFRALTDDLLRAGLKVPVTGVVMGSIPPDTFTVAAELDFTAENAYGDHPAYEPGVEWNGIPFFRMQNLATSTAGNQWVAHASRYHWQGVPLAIREWTVCWPNPWRSTQMPEMAAYGRFQDWDCLLSFGYFTTTELNRLSPFAIQNDPLRWGLFAHGARIFLGKDTIQPAKHTVAIRWSPADLTAWGQSTDPLHSLAYQHRIVNTPAAAQDQQTGGAASGERPSLTILAGKVHETAYPGNDGIIHGQVTADFPGGNRQKSKSVWELSGYDKLRLASPETPNSGPYALAGSRLDDTLTTELPGAVGFVRESILSQGLQPFGNHAELAVSLGGYDSQRRNLVLGQVPTSVLPRIATELLRLREETPTTLEDFDRGIHRADTGEIIRDTGPGRVLIDAPQVLMIGGAFTTGSEVATPGGRLRFVSASSAATVVVVALDGQPIESSRRFSIKMVTDGSNRNQRLAPSQSKTLPGYQMLTAEGSGPIVTRGTHLTTGGARIRLPGRVDLTAAMANGVLETLVDFDTRTVFVHCDLPNARIGLELTPPGATHPVEAFALRAYQHETLVEQEAVPVGPVLSYPGWAKLITLRWN